MKTLVLVLLFTTACFASGSSSVAAPSIAPSVAGPSSVATGSTTAMPADPTSMAADPTSMASPSSSQVASSSSMASASIASSSQVMSSSASVSPSPSSSISPSVSPSQSMSSSVAMSSSASMSSSMSVSPSASSSTAPASSSVTPQPPKPHYDVDVQVEDEHTGKSCLWLKANISVTYSHKNVSGQIALNGKDVKSSGTCSDLTKANDTSEVTLTWENEQIKSMTVQFSTGSKENWFVSKIGVVLDVPLSSNGQVIANKTFREGENTEFLHASQNKSYSCSIQENVTLESTAANVSIAITDIMVQPFTHNNTMVDSKENDACSSKSKSSKSSSIVPIAVGCALAGLIVIVLIAYLIGRRKNDGRGYQQV